MSELNDRMTAILGPNWRTTVTGASNALLSLAGTGAVLTAVLGDKYKVMAAVIAFILAALSAIAKILNALTAADATTVIAQIKTATGTGDGTTKP